MIEIEGLTHSYDRAVVLDDVGLTLPRGQLTSLVGPNGAGKSTLLSAATRLLVPDRGRVLLDGLDVATARSEEVARRLAVLRQDNRIAARLTVRDLVRFGRFPHGQGRLRPDDDTIVADSLTYVGMDTLADRYLDQLSGGQRQRAFIAMVLAQDTEYLMLDEPLNNLDLRHAVSTMAMLRRACSELGRTVVLVLHDINFASAWSDHVVGMRDGAVVAQGTPEEFMEPDVLERVFGLPMHVTMVGEHRLAHYWTAAADPSR